MGNLITTSIFDDLKNQIFDRSKWDNKVFSVFGYEAGAGKSRNVQRYLAETEDRALYVQRFSKDGELDATAERINTLAGKEIAVAFTGEDTKRKRVRKRAIEARTLCITHKMYSNICRGDHQDLIEGRVILVIDEYPDLLEQITVTYKEIGQLWTDIFQYGFAETDDLASLLRDMANKYSNDSEILKNREMVFVSFQSDKYDKYKDVIGQLLKKTKQARKSEHKELLFKFQQILNNGAYYYEGGFHTFDSTPKFAMLDCNIILDANAFDYRYSLSNKFKVIKQPKIYDYSQAEFYHYDLNTSKRALKNYINLTEKALEQIDLKDSGGVLFITEQVQKEQVEKGIEAYFNDSLDGVQETLRMPLTVDYFGNLIGKNTYRNYNMVIVQKSPNFDYGTYALTNFFYKYHENLPIANISIFQDEDVEKVRLSTIAGEIYQAIRRIARDNPEDAKIYVFNNNQGVIDIVLEQLPGIQYHKCQIEVNKIGKEAGAKDKGKKEKMPTQFDEKVEEVKAILTNLQQSGKSYIRKKDVRVQVGIKDGANFSKVLDVLRPFLQINQIKNQGQKIIFD
ncbi:hypothetical protein [Schinkia azotoformans]|uniref:hypothetical protein n=1 Tax=Schinkia azotoformans TaxID=1454 RepID=UPI002DB8822E|nr:hypothetical protein [Schinkia azotoformans]MEC1722845.1 hypothetical protein [Schinkia azotoformans]MED4414257.1 hypothetical protein [Schinkia azotoformans]